VGEDPGPIALIVQVCPCWVCRVSSQARLELPRSHDRSPTAPESPTATVSNIPAKAPSLLAISVAWSLVIASIMTGITFLHQTPGEVASVSGGLGLKQIGFLFLIWFVAAEVTLVVGGGLYLGAALLRRKARGGG